MKKVVFSALLLAGLTTMTSCKKAYSCECVTNVETENGDPYTTSKIVSLDQKMKEKQAVAACDQTSSQIAAQNQEIINNDPNEEYVSMTTVCSVK